MSEHIFIRKYEEEDHQDVKRIFAQGVYENVRKGIMHGLSSSKVILCLLATFSIGTKVSIFVGCMSLLLGLILYSSAVFFCYGLYARYFFSR